MGDYVLLDESPLSFRIPNDLDDASCDAIRRILESRNSKPPFDGPSSSLSVNTWNSPPSGYASLYDATPKHPPEQNALYCAILLSAAGNDRLRPFL